MTSASVDRTWAFFAGAASKADVLVDISMFVIDEVGVNTFGCWARKALVLIIDQPTLPRRRMILKVDRTMGKYAILCN